jgi:hypothetical protein
MEIEVTKKEFIEISSKYISDIVYLKSELNSKGECGEMRLENGMVFIFKNEKDIYPIINWIPPNCKAEDTLYTIDDIHSYIKKYDYYYRIAAVDTDFKTIDLTIEVKDSPLSRIYRPVKFKLKYTALNFEYLKTGLSKQSR